MTGGLIMSLEGACAKSHTCSAFEGWSLKFGGDLAPRRRLELRLRLLVFVGVELRISNLMICEPAWVFSEELGLIFRNGLSLEHTIVHRLAAVCARTC